VTGLFSLQGVEPDVHPDAWVAPGAQVIGKVVLLAGASVWFNAVLRGDNEVIRVGAGSNVQDGCILHTDMGFPLEIGENCTVGHMAVLHGCTIGENSLIGMGATVLNGARIGRNVLVGAGSLVTEGKEIPEGCLLMGRPAKVVRDLAPDEVRTLRQSAERYRLNAARFRDHLTPVAPPAR
jgi:carbonic anhydrase/acetyltransferase-like protein (isoleucine patch superfamily)